MGHQPLTAPQSQVSGEVGSLQPHSSPATQPLWHYLVLLRTSWQPTLLLQFLLLAIS